MAEVTAAEVVEVSTAVALAAFMAVDLTAAHAAAARATEGRGDTPPAAVPAREGRGLPRAEAFGTLRRG